MSGRPEENSDEEQVLSNDTSSVAENRVWKVLHQLLAADQADQGMLIWRQRYRDARLTGLVSFVTELTRLFKLEPQRRKDLVTELFRELSGVHGGDSAVAARSKPDPVTQTPRESSDHDASDHDARVVFRSVGQALFEGIDPLNAAAAEEFRRTVLRQLQALGLDADLQHALLAWFAGKPVPEPGSLMTSQLAPIIHAIYVALCEALGPVQADALLDQAVGRARQLHEARHFSPHRLL